MMTALLRLIERMPHQVAPDPALAEIGRYRQRSEQQRRPSRTGRDAPQPDGADHAAVRAGDERQAFGRQPVLAQPLGGLAEAAIAECRIEQRLAPGDIEGGLVTNRDHGRALCALKNAWTMGFDGSGAGTAGSRASNPRQAQM